MKKNSDSEMYAARTAEVLRTHRSAEVHAAARLPTGEASVMLPVAAKAEGVCFCALSYSTSTTYEAMRPLG